MGQSSASLCLIFIFTAIFPRILLPLLGIRKSIQYVFFQCGVNRAETGGKGCREKKPGALTPPTPKHAHRICSLLFAAGFALLGSASSTNVVLLSLVVIAAGSVSLPATLALLTNQVSAGEKGAVNGAADTVRTLSSALGFPIMTGLFGFFISDKAPFKLPGMRVCFERCGWVSKKKKATAAHSSSSPIAPTNTKTGASLFLGSALSVLALGILQIAFTFYDHHDQHK